MNKWKWAMAMAFVVPLLMGADDAFFKFSSIDTTVAGGGTSTNDSTVWYLQDYPSEKALFTLSVNGSAPNATGGVVVATFARGVPDDMDGTNYVWDTAANSDLTVTLTPDSNQLSQVSKVLDVSGAKQIKLIKWSSTTVGAISNFNARAARLPLND